MADTIGVITSLEVFKNKLEHEFRLAMQQQSTEHLNGIDRAAVASFRVSRIIQWIEEGMRLDLPLIVTVDRKDIERTVTELRPPSK